MRRILQVVRSVDPAAGGPIEFVKQAGAALAGCGVETEVASLGGPHEPGAEAFPLRRHVLGPSVGGYGYTAAALPWLRSNRERFDAVLVNGLWQYQSLAVWRALRRTRTRYFVLPHGMLDPWFKRTYPLKHFKKSLYWPWAEYRVLRDAAAVLFTCEEERRLARESFRRYRCRERILHLGTAAPAGDPERQRAEFHERFPSLRGKRCLLFLGRMHVKKGPDLALEALAEIRRRKAGEGGGDEIRLVMAGPRDSAYARRLEQRAASLGIGGAVVWTGMLTGDLKWGAFHSAEAFLLPSHQENFGLAVVEALACGCPVLISRQVNIWREIEADGAGLVDSDDRAGAVRLVSGWLETEAGVWESRRQRARACFQSRFSIERMASALAALVAEEAAV